jgi:hypothetical protein
MPTTTSTAGFTIQELRIDRARTPIDNYGGGALAEAWIAIGPVKLRAYLGMDGHLRIDGHQLPDQVLRGAIGCALRKAALEQLTRDWMYLDALADFDAAKTLLRRIYDTPTGAPEVRAICRQYNVNRLFEIPCTEGPALLSAARALAVKLSVSTVDPT